MIDCCWASSVRVLRSGSLSADGGLRGSVDNDGVGELHEHSGNGGGEGQNKGQNEANEAHAAAHVVSRACLEHGEEGERREKGIVMTGCRTVNTSW